MQVHLRLDCEEYHVKTSNPQSAFMNEATE